MQSVQQGVRFLNHDTVTNAQVVVLPGAGHSIMVEEPNALLDALHKVL